MTHRLRVLAALGGLLLLTFLATWFLAGRLALYPLVEALSSERVDTAVYLARVVEAAPDPAGRAWQLSQELGVDIDPVVKRPEASSAYRVLRERRREIWISKRPALPLYVSTKGLPVWGMSLSWPVDIESPRRRVGWGFPILSLLVLAGAAVVSGWVLGPLRDTSRAMDRVAQGDLDVRVPEGRDEAGRIGATFNRMAERVSGMVRGQRRLVAGVSHELRTPLARMRLLTELMRDGGADPARLTAIEAEITNIDGLVGELLESARMEEGAIALARERLAVRDLVGQALTATDLGDRQVQLDIERTLEVEVDRVRMVRVLENLLTNIARYTPSSAQVTIAASHWTGETFGNPWTRITVADDGPGVPAEDLPQLFEPFFRGEQSRSRATGGLGLGLMLVRQIVEAHGGRIRAVSPPDGGLQVNIDLPNPSPRTSPA